MEAVAPIHPCALCSGPGRPASDQCPRCWRWLCPAHAPARGAACEACACGDRGTVRASLTTRMALVSGASVAGMLVGAVSAMLVAGALGLAGEIIVLLMLGAEMGVGALAGRAADRRVDRWLEARARAAMERRLPAARLLHQGRERRRSRALRCGRPGRVRGALAPAPEALAAAADERPGPGDSEP